MADSALSVVVPAYNEERRLPSLLQALDRSFAGILETTSMHLVQVIVVDDGSTDGTADVVRRFEGLDGKLAMIRFPANRGKGAAVQAGMLAARGDRALMTDADMSTPLDDVVALSRAVDEGADLAIGSRAMQESLVLVHQPLVRERLGKGFNIALRLATGLPWRDTQCGFKLFRLQTTRPLFAAQRINGFAFDAELCVNAHRLGLRLVEVPVRWSNHADTRVRLVSSIRMAVDILRIARSTHRPWAPQDDAGGFAPPLQAADAPVIAVGIAAPEESLRS